MPTNRHPGTPFAHPHGVLAFAHRGERGHYPENTMLAFDNAVALGVDALEIDVHATADGEIVVIHDPTVNRTTNGHGCVRDMTLAELQLLDAGFHWTNDRGRTFPFRGQGLTIPTLAEVFETYPDLWINIDIKQHDLRIIFPFVRLAYEHNMIDKVMVGSFDDKTIYFLRESCPEMATAASMTEVRRLFLLSKLRLDRLYWGDAEALQIPEKYGNMRLITRHFVQAAHRNDMAVHVWTVNKTADMERLLDLGVDGIISDYPKRLLRLLNRFELE
ncbi:MAG: glycerophosphodiester phosphodiesterase [Chloroflexota bacterium]